MSAPYIVIVYDADLQARIPKELAEAFPIVINPDTGFYGPFDGDEAKRLAASIDLPTQVVPLSGWVFPERNDDLVFDDLGAPAPRGSLVEDES